MESCSGCEAYDHTVNSSPLVLAFPPAGPASTTTTVTQCHRCCIKIPFLLIFSNAAGTAASLSLRHWHAGPGPGPPGTPGAGQSRSTNTWPVVSDAGGLASGSAAATVTS
eukprot:1089483-Rhodomonas_salina.2